jgi:hypothetical protein
MTGFFFGDRLLQSGSFKKSETHYHSTFKEILAIKYGIQKFEFHLAQIGILLLYQKYFILFYFKEWSRSWNSKKYFEGKRKTYLDCKSLIGI